MLISEVGEQGEKKIEELTKGYSAKFEIQANNEKLLQQNLESLQKYSE